ncbi:MAG: hypothetical protein GY707_16090, partial [Desulfobacteraceae bacterium]|nr:hypothetical protein [Desulfobacteraceae bacterium]
MKSRRFITLFWILLIVPAIIISAVAFRLLLHEQERINRTAITSLTERGKIIASNIHLTIGEVEESLSQALIDIDSGQLKATLLFWEESNPLVRNVFIWDEHDLLRYPAKGMASTLEERQFIVRFDSIFKNGKVFDTDLHKAGKELSMDFKSSRESLYDLAKAKTVMPAKSLSRQVESEQVLFTPQYGWIPWFAQDQLYILGWVKKKKSGPVYGIE